MNRTLLAIFIVGLGAAGASLAQSPARARKPKPAGDAPVAAVQNLTPPTDKEEGPSETEILAMQGATFNSKERIAVFTGDVRVTDPRFQLACDELTVYLKKTEAPKPVDAAAPTPAAATPDANGDSQNAMGGGIDHAVARGHAIIVQERAATDGGAPKRSVGRGERVEFDNNTGDMVLRGLPSVEQNGSTHVATSPNTVMTLRRDNSLTTKGPSRTVIIQNKSDEKPGAAATPAPKG